MIKKLKKVKIIFAILLVLYSGIVMPKRNVVRADGGASLVAGGGMLLGSLNPAVWPVIIIGLVACVILGLAYENREELQALGQSVAVQLNEMGHSIWDFVSGTSVTVNDTLKTAIYRAADGMGASIPGYVEGAYIGNGQYSVFTGISTNVEIIKLQNKGSLWVGKVDKASSLSDGFGFFRSGFQKEKDILLPSLTVTVNVQPIGSTKNLSLDFSPSSGGGSLGKLTNVSRDNLGNIISVTRVLEVNQFDRFSKLGVFTRNTSGNTYNVTSVTIPELGIGVTAPEVPTDKIRENEYDKATREQVADVVFGGFGTSETITFKPDVPISDVTALSLPLVSDKVYDGSKIKTLEELTAGAVSEAGATTGTVTTGALVGSGTGIFDLSGLWEWLKKILNAILGLPALLLQGLQALFDGLMSILSNIWTSITGLAAGIGTFILDGLKAIFGVDGVWFKTRVENLKLRFGEKFPSIKPINYRFTDKEDVSDISVNLPNVGRQTVVSGSAMTEFAKVVKVFLRGLFYMLLALFFFRKFHKTAEG